MVLLIFNLRFKRSAIGRGCGRRRTVTMCAREYLLVQLEYNSEPRVPCRRGLLLMEAGEVYCWSRCCDDDGSRSGALLMGAAEAGGLEGAAGGLEHQRLQWSAHVTSPTRRGHRQSAHLTSRRGEGAG